MQVTRDFEVVEVKVSKPRGFAAMSLEDRRAIAANGGRRSHQLGRAHRWTREEARAAGKKGGSISRRRPREVDLEQEGEV